MIDEVRAALAGYGPMREVEMPGGVVFEWDGDAVASVQNGVARVRVEGGWATVTGDVGTAVLLACRVVLAECVEGWHEEIWALGPGASQALLALVRHDPEREQLQRLLLDLTHRPELRQLAVTCLGHIGTFDRAVLPEVVPRLEELLDDPVLGGVAEDALGDVESAIHPFTLWRRNSVPWVVVAPPGDAEVARQCALVEAPDEVVVIPHADTLPSLYEYVRGLCGQPGLHFVLEYDGDIAALQPLLEDEEDQTAVIEGHYLLVW
ncbi:hypothetical protein JNUCC0626_45415 [Lentzea sp. JNUCC 0626]|uniref:hypothetical protein n=1 Tax=Lentzea sp. JNUCC 0626 TaxID=3367513 RepID=UPI003748F3C0